MKLLYVVQRYGEEIVGGSETACRAFAENLVKAGHQVEVLTSCAKNYTDWKNEIRPGVSMVGGVLVNRLPVVQERVASDFGPLHHWILQHPGSAPRFEQERWNRLMGPWLQNQSEWLRENATRFDAVIFMTYLYATTTIGLRHVVGRVPTLLQPTAHDEPAIYLGQFQTLFRLPDHLVYFTPDEKDFVESHFGLDKSGTVVGYGLDPVSGVPTPPVCNSPGTDVPPYIIYVGRLDPSKGVEELIDFFRAYKLRHDTDLQLLLVGDRVVDIPSDDDIRVIGFVDEVEKAELIAGAVGLVQPSYFESFSIVIMEAWQHRVPVLAQAKCAVLNGHVQRSRGGLTYDGFAEFEVALELLLEYPQLRAKFGRNGMRYAKENYEWQTVLGRLENAIHAAMQRFKDRFAT